MIPDSTDKTLEEKIREWEERMERKREEEEAKEKKEIEKRKRDGYLPNRER